MGGAGQGIIERASMRVKASGELEMGTLRVDTDFDALLPKDVTQKVSAANEQIWVAKPEASPKSETD